MLKIFMFILITDMVFSDSEEESNEKYIDLLPEEEKQEFLNRIARRIFEEIKNGEIPNQSHAEINDDQLDAHHAFVQDIINEESENHKSERRADSDRNDENDKERYIDLTLRDGRREKRKNNDEDFALETTSELPYDVIPVRTVYDEDDDYIKESISKKVNQEIVKKAKSEKSPSNSTENMNVTQSSKGEGGFENINGEISSNFRNSLSKQLSNNHVKTVVIDEHPNSEEIKSIVHDNSNYEISEIGSTKNVGIDHSLLGNGGSERRNGEISNDLHKSQLNNNHGKNAFIDDHTSSEEMKSTVHDNNYSEISDTGSTENVNINKSLIVLSGLETINSEISNHLQKSQLNNYHGKTALIDENPNSEEMKSTVDDNSNYDISETASIENSLNSTSSNITIKNSTEKIYESIDNENGSKGSENELNNITLKTIENTAISKSTSTTFFSYIETQSSISNITTANTESTNLVTDKVYISQKFQRSGSDVNQTLKSTRYEDVITTPLVFKLIENSTENNSISTEEIFNRTFTPKRSNQSLFHVSKNINNNLVTEEKNVSDMNISNKPILRQNSHNFERKINEPVLNVVVHPKKEYEVYEVAAEKPPFVLQDNEAPNYVPIYNYAPEYAYFRPKDRFDPNIVDVIVKSYDKGTNAGKNKNSGKNSQKRKIGTGKYPSHPAPDIRSTFMRNKNRGRVKVYPIKQYSQNIFGFLRPVHKKIKDPNIFYNPYDYMDMDYANKINGLNILRGGIERKNFDEKFPDSNEPDHPITLIHKSDTIKDHVGAVRHLLYLKKIYGYIPAIGEKRKFAKPRIRIKIEKPKKKTENIAIDYYFGRVHSEEEEPTNIISNVNDKSKSYTEIAETDQTKNIDFEQAVHDTKFEDFFDHMLNVLEDIIRFDNNALKQYAWLKTTVDIQIAIHKLLNLSYDLQYGEYLRHEDLELLKYALYLFKISKTEVDQQEKEERNLSDSSVKRKKKHKGLLPKTKRKDKIKQPLKLWKDFFTFLRNIQAVEMDFGKIDIFYDFERFLHELMFHLNDLHQAIKHIAIITTYENQNWYRDLKAIYLNKASRNKIGSVILHLSLVKFIDEVNQAAENGAAEDYRGFIKNNNEEVEKVKEDLVFVLQIIKQLKVL